MPINGPGLRDAKPRRPRAMRQSTGWDPTVDICEDTFEFHKSTRPAAPAKEEIKSVKGQQHPAKDTRNSTLFAQPAQRISAAPSLAAKGPDQSPKRRRVSVVPGENDEIDENAAKPSKSPGRENPKKNPSRRMSHMRKDPRRMTIYVPSDDTTIMTIHPGNKGTSIRDQEQPRQPTKPRRSDVFFDLATLGEEDIQQEQQKAQSVEKPRRAPGQSLAAAPRRVPLQQSGRQLQQQVNAIDVPGQGAGKENVPPGGLGEVKRLGKRASLLVPEKSTLRSPPSDRDAPSIDAIGAIQEERPASPSLQNRLTSHKQQSASPVRSPSSNGYQQPQPRAQSQQIQDHLARSQSPMGNQRRAVQRQPLGPTPAISTMPAPRRPRFSMIASTLSTSQTSLKDGLTALAKYPTIPENITDPSLYEDQWLSHQECALTHLLNALISPSTSQVPTGFPGNHVSSLRQSLLSTYLSPGISLLHKRLQASLRFGALSIPPDTLSQVARFKDDFGQRQRFIDLWIKTYDLDLLEAALEVVVGRQVSSSKRISGGSSPRTSRAKVIAQFLKAFLVCNQDTASSRASVVDGVGNTMSTSRPPSELDANDTPLARNWRRTTLRGLMLILLLDKVTSLTGSNTGPGTTLLFQRSSPYKSSAAVLHGLSRLLIPSIGDTSRVLCYLGYNVSHMQHPLQEYDYNVRNLAVDLRDGARLAKLVEVLLYPSRSPKGSESNEGAEATLTLSSVEIGMISASGDSGVQGALSRRLICPAISRPQKVCNVAIALDTLASVPSMTRLMSDITPEDVVDGHREKTVKLLWGLVGRWGLDVFVDAGLIEGEIKRLGRELRRQCKGAEVEAFSDRPIEMHDGRMKHARLLHEWAKHASLHFGRSITNLTTSFADGKAYRAIIQAYSPLLCPGATTDTRDTNDPTQQQTLQKIGCSKAFASLFSPSTTNPTSTIPSADTTTLNLALLSSRILPLAQRPIAAMTIQRAYRAYQQKWEVKKRFWASVVVEDAARVVKERERIVWAVNMLQRAWRAYWKLSLGGWRSEAERLQL